MRWRTISARPAGTKRFNPSTWARPASCSRWRSIQRMPKVRAAAMEGWVSSALTPRTAKADWPMLGTAGVNRAAGRLEANLQDGGLRLAEAQHAQAERARV